MDVRKIVSMGLLCGLSLSGSATISSSNSYQAGSLVPAFNCPAGKDCLPFGCLPGFNCKEFQDAFQKIINRMVILVGNNPTPGQKILAPIVAGMFTLYEKLEGDPNALAILKRIFNGSVSPKQLQEFRSALDAEGACILEGIQSVLEQFRPMLLQALQQLPQLLQQAQQALPELLPKMQQALSLPLDYRDNY
jgi:hypothetical protein